MINDWTESGQHVLSELGRLSAEIKDLERKIDQLSDSHHKLDAELAKSNIADMGRTVMLAKDIGRLEANVEHVGKKVDGSTAKLTQSIEGIERRLIHWKALVAGGWFVIVIAYGALEFVIRHTH